MQIKKNNYTKTFFLRPGHPVSQSGQEVLCSEPTVCQQHRRLRPPSNKPHHRYLSGCPQGLPLPPSCLFHSTSIPTSPVHPLHPHCCLQRSMVWSSSQHVHPTPGSCTAGASACQHLAAPGPLPCHSWGTGPDSRAGASPGFPSGQRSAEVSQQPRRTQPEDHVGLGVRAGPDPGPTGLDWTGVGQRGTCSISQSIMCERPAEVEECGREERRSEKADAAVSALCVLCLVVADAVTRSPFSACSSSLPNAQGSRKKTCVCVCAMFKGQRGFDRVRDWCYSVFLCVCRLVWLGHAGSTRN